MIWLEGYLILGFILAEVAAAGLRIKRRAQPETDISGAYLTTLFVWPLVLYVLVREVWK